MVLTTVRDLVKGEVCSYIVVAAGVQAHVIVQRQQDGPAQHLARGRLANVGHDHKGVKDEYQIAVGGEKIEAIGTGSELVRALYCSHHGEGFLFKRRTPECRLRNAA